MAKVKIIGAGSSGNNLASACRQLAWDVTVCDVEEEALTRMRKDIYPNRYGRWDDAIKLSTLDKAPKGGFEFICVCLEPEKHLSMAMEALEEKPQGIVIDRPVCPPHMELAHELMEAGKERGVRLFAAYELTVARGAELIGDMITGHHLGEIVTLEVEYREHWESVLKAQPWVLGPHVSHLGWWEQGGGAGGEHSQALNLWQHLAHLSGKGRVVEVDAMVSYAREGKAVWDSLACWNLRTEKGFTGRVVQDVISKPSRKRARLQGSEGAVELSVNHTPDSDALFVVRPGAPEKITPVHKKKTDDFIAAMRHVWSVTKDGKESAISLERGLDTALLVAAAHQSEQEKCRVRIDWSVGYTPEAIVPCRRPE